MKEKEIYCLLAVTETRGMTILMEGTMIQILKMRNERDNEWKNRNGKMIHHPEEIIEGSKLRFSSYFDNEGDLIGGLIIASKKKLNEMIESGHLEKN